ncbi:MAG: phosphoribosylglycinamide formyltransferase [Kiritimatiellae bacterium]|jgi:phosphoribosylglycinamide formyltransferase-1|nr:phosphoribosylglycinamide formyltransferase [Kiritimatiellia bacterium]
MSVRLGVMASGRGSNFLAIQNEIEQNTMDAEIALLISDRGNAPALELAEKHHVPACTFPYDKSDRAAFEKMAGDAFDAAGCDYIVLAGFMRILTPYFIERFSGRILNIHPSLLPSFKGLRPQRQALEAGVKFSGCTVHLVTSDLDDGPILAQAVVPVFPQDTEETLSARILEQEHRLYAEALRGLCPQ